MSGGYGNVAGGGVSFAAGFQARALHDGAFVWADSTGYPLATPISSTTPNQFVVRATGGISLVTSVDGSGYPSATVSIAETVWLPADLSVALKVPTPLVTVELPGTTAKPSVLLKLTVPL